MHGVLGSARYHHTKSSRAFPATTYFWLRQATPTGSRPNTIRLSTPYRQTPYKRHSSTINTPDDCHLSSRFALINLILVITTRVITYTKTSFYKNISVSQADISSWSRVRCQQATQPHPLALRQRQTDTDQPTESDPGYT